MSNVPLGIQHVDNFIDLGGEHRAERDACFRLLSPEAKNLHHIDHQRILRIVYHWG